MDAMDAALDALERRIAEEYRRLAEGNKDAPCPVETPRAFRAWLDARRDAEAVAAGDFPRRGRGWVYVPGARQRNNLVQDRTYTRFSYAGITGGPKMDGVVLTRDEYLDLIARIRLGDVVQATKRRFRGHAGPSLFWRGPVGSAMRETK